MPYQKPAIDTMPLLGPPCPFCAAESYADGDGGSLPTCGCALTAGAEWKFGANDQTEWYREAHEFSWRQLSAAEARMQHTKDAVRSVTVRRVRT